MSSPEADKAYKELEEILSKEYRNPRAVLESRIYELVKKGKSREEAILTLYEEEKHARTETEQQQKTVLEQIANLREKIDSLTTLFSKGEVTEETYLRGVKKIENDIGRLRQEHGIPEQNRTPKGISETARQEAEERELLSGEPAMLLTNKRLIAGTREIHLIDVSEAYAKQGYVSSKLVLRFINGTEEEFEITSTSYGSSDRLGSLFATLTGDITAVEGDLRARSKATVDRWVNLINRLLTGDN